jgi:hypothetical protein
LGYSSDVVWERAHRELTVSLTKAHCTNANGEVGDGLEKLLKGPLTSTERGRFKGWVDMALASLDVRFLQTYNRKQRRGQTMRRMRPGTTLA